MDTGLSLLRGLGCAAGEGSIFAVGVLVVAGTALGLSGVEGVVAGVGLEAAFGAVVSVCAMASDNKALQRMKRANLAFMFSELRRYGILNNFLVLQCILHGFQESLRVFGMHPVPGVFNYVKD